IALVLLTVRLAAHPASTTTVAIDMRQSRVFDVAFSADAQALVTKLEALSRAPLGKSASQDPRELKTRLAALGDQLAEQTDLRFAGERVQPVVERADVDHPGRAVIHLVGSFPAAAREITWSTSLVFGAYPLAIRGPGGVETVRWLQGRERSEPLAI